MVERLVNSTRSGWSWLALGAAVSTVCAAVVLYRRQRSASREVLDPYEAWWQRRDEIRRNGGSEHSTHLFV